MALKPLAVVIDVREQRRSEVDLAFPAAVLQSRYILVGDCKSEEVGAVLREVVSN